MTSRYLIGWLDQQLVAVFDISALEKKDLFKMVKCEQVALDNGLASAVKYLVDTKSVSEMYAISCDASIAEVKQLFSQNVSESKILIRTHGNKVYPYD